MRRNKIGKFNNDLEELKLSDIVIKEVINNRLKLIKYFDEVYDFSLPNTFINDPSNTYDGSHYFKNFISNLADFMENSNLEFGSAINNYDYPKIFKNSLNSYLNKN